MKKKSSTITLLIVFFVGLSVLLYPTISNYYNSFHQSCSIATYQDNISQLSQADYTDLLQAARDYNTELVRHDQLYFQSGKPMGKAYQRLLNITSDGMMGYITIKELNIQLPIYHGTAENILAGAVGHLEGSSLPVGGIGTHCVLSGHRGLPSAKLFTDLDRLEIGDTFSFCILDETLTYEVDNIAIVEPEDVSLLQIDPEKDYCTLLTCTPYGINSHRLLVRGVRIENEAANMLHVAADAIQIDPILVAPALAAPILILLLILLLTSSSFKGGRKDKPRKDSSRKVGDS